MGNTVRHFVCWCLMLVLPLQALAGMIRIHGPHTGEHSLHAAHADPHAVPHAGPHMHANSAHPMTASQGAATGEPVPAETPCAHHAAPNCSACQSSSNELADFSNLPPSCNTCALCCLLLIPAPLALVPPAGTNSSPPDRDARFRSVAPHTLERPPRSFSPA